MKNRIIYVIVITLLLVIPFRLNALEGNLNISCGSTSLKAGEKTDCDIYYSVTQGKIVSFSAKLVGNGLTVNSFKKSTKSGNMWNGENWDKNSNLSSIYVEGNAKSGNVHIGTINVSLDSEVAGKGSLTLTNLNVTDDAGSNKKLSDKSIEIVVLSDDTSLGSLLIDGKDILEAKSYNTNSSVVNVVATPRDVNSQIVSGTGMVSVACGSSVIYVEVESQSGKRKKHSIDVFRMCNNNPYLRDLYAENYKIKPEFKFDTFEYQVTVEANQSTLNIEAFKAEETSKVSGAGKVKVAYGLNTFPITVTAEDGKTKTIYKLVVYRLDNRSNEAALKELNVTNTDIKLVENVSKYATTVDYEVDKVVISASGVGKSTVSGTGEKKLSVGQNKFNIVVKSEKGKKKTYTIYITREKKDTRDTNNLLNSLEVSGFNIDFSNDVDTYEIEGKKDLKSVTVTAEAQSKKATLEIIGGKNLNPGENIVRVRVVAEIGTVKEFKIIIKIPEEEKAPIVEKEEDNNNLLIVVIVSGIVFVGVIVFILIQKKKGETSTFISDEVITDVVKEALEEREKEEKNESNEKL